MRDIDDWGSLHIVPTCGKFELEVGINVGGRSDMIVGEGAKK